MNPDYCFLAERRFPRPRILDIRGAVNAEMERLAGLRGPWSGKKVAVTAGSRGVADIDTVVTATVDHLRKNGAQPFVVPAMGSHGGADAEGQRAVLSGYGITEKSVGAPIVSSMDVDELPRGNLPHPLYIDRAANSADIVVLVNRVKPHTDYSGWPESGLVKMAVIGLGNHALATAIHSFGISGLTDRILPAFRGIREHGPILVGVAIVENAYDEISDIRGLTAEEMETEEPALLEKARRQMPDLPLDDPDILLVDEIGKNISGSGMDPNIIGRYFIDGQEEPSSPDVGVIMARSMTEESHGNSIGTGLADVITRKIFEDIDYRVTYENTVTSTFFRRASIPLIAPDDETGLNWCRRKARSVGRNDHRIIRIRNTLELHRFLASGPIRDEMDGRDDIAFDKKPRNVFSEF